jgi:uncharacterized protein YndB with AHSA1/START domain
MHTIDASATTPASRDQVWQLLADESAWPRWGRWSSATIEGGGAHGLGAIRVLVQRPFTVRELITEWEPGERMTYALLDGMHARGYQASAILEDAPGGGTVVRWHSEYASADPITALLLRLAARDTVKRLARAAAANAPGSAARVPTGLG